MGDHDKLFKRVFRVPAHAAGELAAVLPPDVAARIDLQSLELVSGAFVNAELAERLTDLLFRARFIDSDVPGYIGLLLEHQSGPDPWMVLRALEYVVAKWRELANTEPSRRTLPPIVCVVVHHGPAGWNAPTRIRELVEGLDAAPELLRFVPDFELTVDDLVAQTDGALDARPLANFPKVALWFLRDARKTTALLAHLESWKHQLRQIIDDDPAGPRGEDIVSLMSYLLSVAGPNVSGDIQRRIAEVVPGTEIAMQSAAEQLIQQGRVEGRAGALRDTLARLLKARFGTVSRDVEARIADATVDDLDRWIEQFATASAIHEVFAD